MRVAGTKTEGREARLRAATTVMGYALDTGDGEIGHVEGFGVDFGRVLPANLLGGGSEGLGIARAHRNARAFSSEAAAHGRILPPATAGGRA